MRAILANERRTVGRFPRLWEADAKAAALLRGLAFRPYAALAALALLCCVLFLPGIATLPVTDRDEARFAQASKQMLETGDYIDIRLQDKPRYKKPAGIYWLQAAAVSLARNAGAALSDIWAYRIPSFLGALAAVLLTFWAGRAVIGRESALIAATLFATCLMLAFESRIAKSDAALVGTIALSQGALFRLYTAPAGTATRGLAALFWLGLGAGILIKGPVAPALALLTSIAVLLTVPRRSWLKNLYWTWGVPLLLAVTLPWLIAIGFASHGEFFSHSVAQDFAWKIQTAREKHWGAPGFYVLAFWWTFWPATLFITGRRLRGLWKLRRSRRVIFLLAWIVPFWIVLEAIPTKLPHYALPLYPAIAMVAALALRSETPPRSRVSVIVWGFIAALQIALLLGLALLAEAPQFPLLAAIFAILAAVAAITIVAAWRSYWHLALWGMVLSGALCYGAGFRIALPALEPIWITEKASAAARSLESCGKEPPGFAGLNEMSLVFRNGTDTILTTPVALAWMLSLDQARVAFVSWRGGHDFEQAFLRRTGHEPRLLGCVDGIGLNGQGATRLQVYAGPEAADKPGCTPIPAIACRPKTDVRWRRLLNTDF